MIKRTVLQEGRLLVGYWQGKLNGLIQAFCRLSS